MQSPLIATQSLKDTFQNYRISDISQDSKSLEELQQKFMKLENKVDAICIALLKLTESLPKKRSTKRVIKKDIITTSDQFDQSEPGTPIAERINMKLLPRLI